MAQHRSDIQFVVVGQRFSEKDEAIQFQRALERTASSPQLSGRFHFLGARTDVDRLLNELTLLVHAARQEPLGRVLLEAAAAGTAVVATRVGGTAEIFPGEPSAAWLVPPRDADSLAHAVGRLLPRQLMRDRVSLVVSL